MNKKLLTLILFSFTISAFGYAQKTDWANFNRYEKSNQEITQPVKVVFMGNSITQNWYSYHPDFFNSNNFAGRGISGQTSSQMLVRFRRDVIDLKPKVVVINAGTNDIALNNGPIKVTNIMGNIESMCQLAKANKIKVILTSVLPASQFPWRKQVKPVSSIILLNDLISAYAQDNKIPYVDYYSALVDNKGGLPKKYSNDGVHPTMDGYVIMEELILKQIRKMVR